MAVSALLFISMEGSRGGKSVERTPLVPNPVSPSAKPVHATAANTAPCLGGKTIPIPEVIKNPFATQNTRLVCQSVCKRKKKKRLSE